MTDPKRRGRRYLDGETRSIPVTVALPPRDYDRLCREAQRTDTTLPAVIRTKIARADEADDDE